jgi:hypothetical protein
MDELADKKHQEMVMSRLALSMLIAIIVTLLMITGYLFAADMGGQVACQARLKGDGIEVRRQDGVVTLTGTVSSAPRSLLAAETVTGLPGVARGKPHHQRMIVMAGFARHR